MPFKSISQVLLDVRGIIAEQLATDLDAVKPESKFVDLGADSLDTVEIMMALEEKFELQLDEAGAEKISTVQVQVHCAGPAILKLDLDIKISWAKQCALSLSGHITTPVLKEKSIFVLNLYRHCGKIGGACL